MRRHSSEDQFWRLSIKGQSRVTRRNLSFILLIAPADCRLIVKGPHATSLAMSTVYSIACHCQCQQVTCQCVAVAFLTLDKTPWPLFCQQAPRNSDDTEDIELKLRAFEGTHSTWDPQSLEADPGHSFSIIPRFGILSFKYAIQPQKAMGSRRRR
jgi:hypothetical protein